jgi:Domain of unknown function (DUF4760)
MGQVTHEQVNLLLQLYELRREPRLRQARAWFAANYHVTSPEEMQTKYPFGTEENTHIRMTVSYWEMVANFVKRGLIDEEFFFENTGEIWLVWDRIRAVVPGMRASMKNPHVFEALEEVCTRLEAWREKRAPGSTAAMRQMMEQMSRVAAKAARE